MTDSGHPASNATGDVEIKSTTQALIEEYAMIWGEPAPAGEQDYYAKANAKNQAALCLSGGGIRSAAFALGVLQSLAAKKLLTQFNFVSSVSGGGYTNSWLQRWIYEQGSAESVAAALRATKEPQEIKRLRAYSNFITPRVGLGSNDTWTAIAMSARNIVTNWLLFAPLFLLLALVPNLFYSCVASIGPRADTHLFLFYVPLGIGAAALGTASFVTCRMLPSYRAPGAARGGDSWLFGGVVAPLIVWSVAATLALSAELIDKPNVTDVLARYWAPLGTFPPGAIVAATTLLAMILAFLAAGLIGRPRAQRSTFLSDVPVALLPMLLIPALILLGVELFDNLAPDRDPATNTHQPGEKGTDWRGLLLTTLAPIWLLFTQLAATILFVALRKARGVAARPDDDREWLARLSAMKIKPMLLWAALAFAALLASALLLRYAAAFDTSLSTMLAAITGTAAVAGGRSAKTERQPGRLAGFVMKYLPVQGLITAATFLFLLLLLLLFARLEWELIEPIGTAIGPALPDWADQDVMAHWVLILGLALLLWVLGGRIDVNRFSLNGLYRNRLARAFLGAARPERDPDPFTGFDAADNVRLHSLARLGPDETPRRNLFPIINVALNVTSSDNLAWQERMAQPFVFTPLHSGGPLLDPGSHGEGERSGAFVATQLYGGKESDLAMPGTGVSLATAMSISGAAASPNMGYHSSPATALLMTLFNVRLGAWMSNPAVANARGNRISESGPGNSLRALLRELTGATDECGRDIYLSDGGHFENLGLYEMLRRRCRYIVISDAGCDPRCDFTDLGNAIRKAKIDLDIDVRFGRIDIHERQPRNGSIEGQRAWALGTIRYPEGLEGQILYIKPSFFGNDLPTDVIAYGAEHATFPHESTGDQFFSESQFESYRKLGCFIAAGIVEGEYSTMNDFFEALAKADTR